MKRTITRDGGATWAEYLDQKPRMFESRAEAVKGLGGLLILVLFFFVLFMWGLV